MVSDLLGEGAGDDYGIDREELVRQRVTCPGEGKDGRDWDLDFGLFWAILGLKVGA